ncbi:MAG: hypothetical protein J6N21_07850, partial [Butyrivibrio sp.]|nr:hypothetical protein [Butyrivibrio sp.]
MTDNNHIEESYTEVVRTFHKTDKQATNTVNVEQNINVVNIEMGKSSLLDKIDLEPIKEWLREHMVQVIVGGILVLYTVILLVMMLTVARYKYIIRENEVQKAASDSILQSEPELEDPIEEIVPVKTESSAMDETRSTIVESEPEETVVEAAELEEPVTEK